MKKSVLFIIAAALIAGAATSSAATGDIIRPIYSTDIQTFMDSIPIKGYAIDGKTMICLEDLEPYGFSVYYSDEARALFVNKQKKADSSFYPTIENSAPGDICGYTYETDIRAYVNGQEIPAENIGGKLAVCAEDLADINALSSLRNFTFKYPSYFMRYTYDDAARSLRLFSDIADDSVYSANIAGFYEGISNSDGVFAAVDEFENDIYSQYVVKGIYADAANYDGCNAVRFYKNGLTANAESALWEYDFIAYMLQDGISITDMRFSADGKYLSFSGERSKPQKYSLMGMRNVYESGEYMLDMDTFALVKVDVQEYELPPEAERPAIWP